MTITLLPVSEAKDLEIFLGLSSLPLNPNLICWEVLWAPLQRCIQRLPTGHQLCLPTFLGAAMASSLGHSRSPTTTSLLLPVLSAPIPPTVTFQHSVHVVF